MEFVKNTNFMGESLISLTFSIKSFPSTSTEKETPIYSFPDQVMSSLSPLSKKRNILH